MTREIVLSIDIDAETKAVYDAVATIDGLKGFWTPQVSGASEVGETLHFGFEPAPVDLDMTVSSLEPGDCVAWSCSGPWPHWGGTGVEWRLAAGPEGGTRVTLVHGGFDDGYADSEFGSVAYTWALVLGALESFVETGDPQPALR